MLPVTPKSLRSRKAVQIQSIQRGQQPPDRRQYCREATWAGLFSLAGTRNVREPRSSLRPRGRNPRQDQVEPGTGPGACGGRDGDTPIPPEQHSAGPSAEPVRAPEDDSVRPRPHVGSRPDLRSSRTRTNHTLSGRGPKGSKKPIVSLPVAVRSLLQHEPAGPSPLPVPDFEEEQAQSRPEHGPWEDPCVPTAEPAAEQIDSLDPAQPRVVMPPSVSRSGSSGSPDDISAAAPTRPIRSLNHLAEHASVLLELFAQSPHDTTDICDEHRNLITSAAEGIATIQARLRQTAPLVNIESREETIADSTCCICHVKIADTVFMPCRHLIVCAVRMSRTPQSGNQWADRWM